MNLHLAGSTHYYGQQYLSQVMAGEVDFDKAEIMLVREPENSNDANAVAIMWKRDKKSKKLGYVGRNQAAIVARCMDNGGRVTIRNHEICGSEATNYGLYLGTEVLFWKDLKARAVKIQVH